MKLFFNGEELTVSDDISLSQFIKDRGLSPDGTACAVDEQIIPKATWDKFKLEENMHLDVFTLVAGG